tara:strand:- start:249 stop:605 length:357 start_codon:yes stop_codon:yes gene_type:complete
MGYTNYWNQRESFSDGEWDILKGEANKITEPFRNDLDIEEDDKNVIFLNGVGHNAHETFVLTKEKRSLNEWENEETFNKEGAFNFCKTNRKPYDLIVWNILQKAYEIAPKKITIKNDR